MSYIRFEFTKETIEGVTRNFTADVRCSHNEDEARKFHGDLLSDSTVKSIKMERIDE